MIAIQLVSALIGRVTGKGLAANVMEIAPRLRRSGKRVRKGENA
jgi:hypothetical protein